MVKLLEQEIMKIFFQKITLQTGLKTIFVIKKVKKTVISDLNGEEAA